MAGMRIGEGSARCRRDARPRSRHLNRGSVPRGWSERFAVATDHGFKIPGAGIDVAIPPAGKGAVRVRFIAREKGTYEFECSRACGAGHHLMRGAVVVK